MTTQFGTKFPQFYITAPTKCPYLEGMYEKKVFTHLMGENADLLNNTLTHGGFRRSQNIAYRPTCDNCSACVSVRVVVDEFVESKSFKRIHRANRDLLRVTLGATATEEQFSLLRTYLDDRHSDGGMSDMTALDFASMVEDTPVETTLLEYRARTDLTSQKNGPLLGVALSDRLEDGLSMVYSFFDTSQSSRSLGTYMVLDHIVRARQLGLPYVYLGYWVDGSQKMAYKARFKPLEGSQADGWARLPD